MDELTFVWMTDEHTAKIAYMDQPDVDVDINSSWMLIRP